MRRTLCVVCAFAWRCFGRLNVPWSGGEITTTIDRNGGARFAYFTLIGPIKTRAYRKWFVSAVAIATALSNHGSTADFVVLCARESEASLLEDERRILVEIGVNWRYVSAPGRLRSAGFHLGNYKLSVWQHIEYDRIQLLDADVLPARSMDDLFQLPGALSSNVVACPGRVAPLNAGWIALVPDMRHYSSLVALLDGLRVDDNEAPWGARLDGWYDSGGQLRKPGWDFFDAKGNQGHLYSYFRFEALSLAILFFDYDYRLLSYNSTKTMDYSTQKEKPKPPAEVIQILQRNFPCPFPSKRRGLVHAYIHYTGTNKPWRSFKPQNPQFLQWYRAFLSNTTARAPRSSGSVDQPSQLSLLHSIFPDLDPASIMAQTRDMAAAFDNASLAHAKEATTSRDGSGGYSRRPVRRRQRHGAQERG